MQEIEAIAACRETRSRVLFMPALSFEEPGLKPVTINDFFAGNTGGFTASGIGAAIDPPPLEGGAGLNAVALTVPVW